MLPLLALAAAALPSAAVAPAIHWPAERPWPLSGPSVALRTCDKLSAQQLWTPPPSGGTGSIMHKPVAPLALPILTMSMTPSPLPIPGGVDWAPECRLGCACKPPAVCHPALADLPPTTASCSGRAAAAASHRRAAAAQPRPRGSLCGSSTPSRSACPVVHETKMACTAARALLLRGWCSPARGWPRANGWPSRAKPRASA